MREGFPRPVFWLLLVLFSVAAGATVLWFWLVVRDVWIGGQQTVANRFDTSAVLRITVATLLSLAVSSGLLWTHYRRADSYGSPLELFFGVVFVLSLALAVVGALPALFGGG